MFVIVNAYSSKNISLNIVVEDPRATKRSNDEIQGLQIQMQLLSRNEDVRCVNDLTQQDFTKSQPQNRLYPLKTVEPPK